MGLLNGQTIDQTDFFPNYTAGEALALNDAVALNLTDGKVYKASASAWDYRINFIGFALNAAASNGNVVVNNMPMATPNSTLVAGTLYYLSNTQGAVSSTAGTIERRIGRATSTTRLHRPKNGQIVSGLISRSLSGTTAYTNLLAMSAGGAGAYNFTVNGTTIAAHSRADVSPMTTILAPDDVATMTANTSNGGIGTAVVRILDY